MLQVELLLQRIARTTTAPQTADATGVTNATTPSGTTRTRTPSAATVESKATGGRSADQDQTIGFLNPKARRTDTIIRQTCEREHLVHTSMNKRQGNQLN